MSRIDLVRYGTRAGPLALLPPLLAACNAPMEVFSNASDAAHELSRLLWFMIVLSVLVFAGVMIVTYLALRRNRARAVTDVDLTERGIGWIIFGGGVMPVLVLGAIFIVALSGMRAGANPTPSLTIDVTGRQWWWQVEYAFPEPTQRLVTANEIHVPVGAPVRLLLTSADVIHSFWVPQLQGKLDLIPGDTNDLWLLVRKPGTYRGQCAEFCGVQHTNMGLTIVAEDTATFRTWAAQQLAPSNHPTDSVGIAGQRLFVGSACALCHTVRGTEAQGTAGPDLTHVGSRSTIAAGRLTNTIGNLEAWIVNAQSLKPGSNMPTLTGHSGRDLRALTAYVASLK